MTPQQNKALNLWCRECGDVCNRERLFRHSVLNPKKVYRWGEGDFKHYIYKPFLKDYKGKSSTMDQDNGEPSEVYLALCGHFQSDHNVQLPEWPSLR